MVLNPPIVVGPISVCSKWIRVRDLTTGSKVVVLLHVANKAYTIARESSRA